MHDMCAAGWNEPFDKRAGSLKQQNCGANRQQAV